MYINASVYMHIYFQYKHIRISMNREPSQFLQTNEKLCIFIFAYRKFDPLIAHTTI